MVESKKLLSGEEMPMVGFGTYQIRTNEDPDRIYTVLDSAIKTGYRLIDTAYCYRNESDIGVALEKLYEIHNISRNDLFITSKLAPADQGYESAKAIVKQTLSDLRTDYLDLYLIHWPGASKLDPDSDQHLGFRKESWRAFQEMHKQGILKSIGVSNYTVEHLKEMKEYADIQPSVNQVEFNPELYQKELLEYCKENGILLQAYTSLGQGALLKNETVTTLASELKVTPAQLLLKWALQHGVGVIPKSITPDRIAANFQLENCTIADDKMLQLDALNKDHHICWNPYTIR